MVTENTQELLQIMPNNKMERKVYGLFVPLSLKKIYTENNRVN